MGSVSHFTVLVTSFVKEDLARAWTEATLLYPDHVSPIVSSRMNGYATFMVAPTGSKYDGPDCRDAFIEWLRANAWKASGLDLMLDWVLVGYGLDHGRATIMGDCMEDDE